MVPPDVFSRDLHQPSVKTDDKLEPEKALALPEKASALPEAPSAQPEVGMAIFPAGSDIRRISDPSGLGSGMNFDPWVLPAPDPR
jgi:hypothetical protein